MAGTSFMLLAGGYDLFLTGGWDVMWFFLDYAMIGFFIMTFSFWKLCFKSKYVWPGMADLSLGGLKEEIDNYEALYMPREPGKIDQVFAKIFEWDFYTSK